ncbi:MAG: transporter [Geobacter sp.]|nr:transporter [Geobacter sp.]
MNKSKYIGSRKTIVSAAIFLFFFMHAANVNASGIPLNVIGPHEYALPVNYDSFNAIVQYGFLQTDNMAYDNNGHRGSGPGTTTAVGLTKYVHFFTVKSLPDVGLAWEIVLPEISVQKPGFSASGIGDPLPGFAAWIKPSKNSTLGLQSFLSVPVGSDAVSDKTWGSLTTIIGDVQLGDLDICGHTGYIFKSTRHQTGVNDVDPGSTFHANLRFGYRAHKYLEPFLGVDYQVTGSSKDEVTGQKIVNSNSNETALGAGMMLNFTDSMNLTARYDYGVEGKNTPVSNSLNFKFAFIW